MLALTEQQRNEKRLDGLCEEKKAVLNELALREFDKPVKYRAKAVTLLDFVEYY